ncbi:CsgG/HfaB family protein [Thermosulfuriphilus sp.]
MMESFVREGVDPSYIKRVAVLKFENNSQDSYAAERLRNITMTQILSLGLFDVIDKAMVDVVLEEQMLGDKVSLDKSTLRRIAKKLGVQALVVGSVDAYEEKREGSYTYPVIALTLRLIDGASGEVIWQASGTASGYSTVGRLFGLRPQDFTQVSFNLVERLLKTLK